MTTATKPEVDLSPEDMLAAQLGLSLDTNAKREAYASRILKKWQDLGWIDGEICEKANFPELKTPDQKRAMALILENQMRYQRFKDRMAPVITGPDGKQYVRGSSLQADVTTADEALPTIQVMPIIRRVYALLLQRDFSVIQPMAGPTSWVFFLDFIRQVDNTNILSVEYNQMLTAELGVPNKGKLSLNRVQINAVKQLLGLTWSLEAEEDAQALLGMNVESELMNAFTQEFARNLLARHLQTIWVAAGVAGSAGVAAIGQSLPAPWNAVNPTVIIPARGTTTFTDYKSQVYDSLVDADTNFQRANFLPSTGIIAGYGLAGFLRKCFTATATKNVDDGGLSSLGVTNYGNYEGRWDILGTNYLPDNAGFVYRKNPDPLYAGHVYAPYVPLMATPRIYAGFSTSTGAYTNTDEYTRNLRERSADICVKPYAFMPISAASLAL